MDRAIENREATKQLGAPTTIWQRSIPNWQVQTLGGDEQTGQGWWTKQTGRRSVLCQSAEDRWV